MRSTYMLHRENSTNKGRLSWVLPQSDFFLLNCAKLKFSAISVHSFWRYEHFSERYFHFLLLLAETSEQHRYLVIVIDYRVHGTQNDQLEPSDSTQKSKYSLRPEILAKMYLGFCYKQQNLTTKNENGTQKNVLIFKSNAPKLCVYQGLDFFKIWPCNALMK